MMASLFSFLRTGACFGVRCSATPVVEIWRGSQNLVFLKDLGGDVEGRLLESSVRSRGTLRPAPGSGRVISPSAKFYSSRTTSCAYRTKEEYGLSSNTVTDWGVFCRETMLMIMAGCSEKLGGPNKIVEIDESKLGRRKYHRDTLLRVSEYLVVLNEIPAEHYFFPYRTETLTPWSHYTWLDRTRHYGHQWQLGCVPQSRVTGFHAPHL